MRNKVFVYSLVLIIGILLIGCAKSGGSGAKKEDIVTLSMWNRYPELNEPFAEFIQKFEEDNPNIKVELQNLPNASQQAQYQTAIAENSLPDIFTTSQELSKLVELDLVMDLDELFPQEEKDLYFPGTWIENGSTLNGTVYTLPLFSPNHGVYMLYYNKDILEEFNISVDDLPKTWDEFIDTGKKIYEESDGKKYGFMWYNVGWANNDFVNLQSTAINPDTPSNINLKQGEPEYLNDGNIQIIQLLKRMLDEKVMHPMSLEIDAPKALANFSAGNAAFYIAGNWQGGNLNANGFHNWGVTDMPTIDGKEIYHPAVTDANGLQVSKDTKHWDEVKIFMEYAKEHIFDDLVLQAGTTQPAKMEIAGDVPYPQFSDILDLMSKYTLPVPEAIERSLDIVEFERKLNAELQISAGDVAVGYMAGEIKDLEGTLLKIDEEAKAAFNRLVAADSSVTQELYQFPNWEPFTPYMAEDYEDLK